MLQLGTKTIYRFAPGLRSRVHGMVRVPPPNQSDAPTPAAAPGDPNEPYLFKPSALSDDPEAPVTVDQLYHLSRSL